MFRSLRNANIPGWQAIPLGRSAWFNHFSLRWRRYINEVSSSPTRGDQGNNPDGWANNSIHDLTWCPCGFNFYWRSTTSE
ncbi:hypothetical protein QO002_005404 [Pararhizobium capsulatum DSM 1112]|uniref:Transposase n=1 Tax=Pararhizobium capsulatum DSM 1112 TaxID=1121113 RepID=A0ABU0BZ18_9HYPH|nr:hypothetical protein [Pararhizobium capsulatum DSM 1112]